MAQQAVLVPSGKLPVDPIEVKGYDFNDGVDYHKLLQSYATTGFQATNFGRAVEEINRMIAKKQEPYPLSEGEDPIDSSGRAKTNCKIFLGFTSNMTSSGVRDTIRYLCQHNMVDCVVTTAGGVEEDFIKCLAPTYVGDFNLKGKDLRLNGINRIGNLLAPNDNYCKFEDWIMPILNAMLKEQQEEGAMWTPSKMIARLGKEIDNPDSIYYWCYKNNIPVYSPALTDGSIGDMLYFHSFKNPGLHTGMVIIGGGLIKHHIANANLMRNGADFSVYVNTAQEFDGSDSGARPDEAVSWGKIKITATPVKVYLEDYVICPFLCFL
ncbi:hypothetical protein CAPTEDRAFT_1610 [Capitella teleta]|uniref:deoxyhypusine synthase n=1 Tax=Capitella teleta TaxID=283909 RepID=X1Z931_CAPTE|nr:hypothetical protein CAPTEDRAFT_1610 [Capitella teleta]|eukprot:ELU10093.1 hypothetical protein CAPTEDRAFT_1610 [Capitella teleta]